MLSGEATVGSDIADIKAGRSRGRFQAFSSNGHLFLTELARQLSTVNADSSQTSSSRLGEFSPSPNRNSYTIACIDDSPVVLKTINSFLDDKTFRTILISDPVRALMQVIRSKPNLVLLDVTMPNLDGYELCSLLRRHPNFRNMPVVMITSHAGLIDRARAKLAGATGYLVKPFTQSDLVKLVFRHLT
ncbi:MAG: response regulator [Cyanobacteria bacterium CRU_2_1]|nr:response regulator [Cyanobacteria bacterium CRU_2_1]